MKTEVGFQPRQRAKCGTEVPPPGENKLKVPSPKKDTVDGGEALASQKEETELMSHLQCHFQGKGEAEGFSGTEVPPPSENKLKVPSPKKDTVDGGEALASQKEQTGLKSHLQSHFHKKGEAEGFSGTKASPPRRYSHLPHIDLIGHYQFVTFRTRESVDEFIRKWDFSPAISNKEKQLKIDEYLDSSQNGAYLQDEVLSYLYEFFIANDKKLYELVAFCIMNNHVHILFKPLVSLSKVMQRIKGASAKKINELLGKNGKFWADDYYDKAIRDEQHFWVVYEYIRNNPLKIGGAKPLHPKHSGTEVPPPGENKLKALSPQKDTIDGSGALALQKEEIGGEASALQKEKTGLKSHLQCHFQEKDEAEGFSGTEVPPPRFYGVFE